MRRLAKVIALLLIAATPALAHDGVHDTWFHAYPVNTHTH